jgi:hypothetical protein
MSLPQKRRYDYLHLFMHSRAPFRTIFAVLLRKLGIGSFEFRLALGTLERPHYAFVVYNAAKLAKKLGHPRISVLEYGVAGGCGLLVLEKYAAEVEQLLHVKIDVYGFDAGGGLPPPKDYRDLPYHWKTGMFRMDETKLRRQLRRATLVVGNIEETSRTFFQQFNPAPIGAVIHDFDFYSSTKTALEMLLAGPTHYLPRVFGYFDDTIGTETEVYNDYTGERLAINEFNQENCDVKLAQPYYLLAIPGPVWHHQIWVCHFFKHPEYNTFVSLDDQQLPIAG